MPFWKFTGTKPVRVGGARITTGMIVNFSGSPGANFEEVANERGDSLPDKSSPPKATSSHSSSSSSGGSSTSKKEK